MSDLARDKIIKLIGIKKILVNFENLASSFFTILSEGYIQLIMGRVSFDSMSYEVEVKRRML